MRLTIAFGLSGAVLVALAARLAGQAAGAGWLLVAAQVDVAVCLLALAALYGAREAGCNVEAILVRPGWSPALRLILLPYLALGAITLYVARWFDREGLLNVVAPGICVGRLPFPFERGQLRTAGIDAVLNLCWEFPRLSGMDCAAGMETAHVPILDARAPSDQQFEEAAQFIARCQAEGRRLLIHCAQGHGRTATIAAAALVQLGLATDVDDALAQIRTVRPHAKPSPAQRAALMRYIAGRRAG